MPLSGEAVALLVRIVEYIEKAADHGPLDPEARVRCIRDYVRLSSLSVDEPIDSYITSTVTGKQYKLHFPANPEGFLLQLIQSFIIRRDSAHVRGLVSGLNDCLQDPAVHHGVKFNILNVENSLVRHAVITDLVAEDSALGRAFCDIRRRLVLDALGHPTDYFNEFVAPANCSVLMRLHRLYVDTERDLYLRFGQRDAVMPFFDEVLTATGARRDVVADVLWSAIEANHRAALMPAEAMREKVDSLRAAVDEDQILLMDRAIEYGTEYSGVDVRSMTVELANPTFRGIDPASLYTAIQFVLPLEPRETEARREANLPDGRAFKVSFRRITSVYEDPAMVHLSNIGSESVSGLPTSFLSDVNTAPEPGSTAILFNLDGCLALDFDVQADGTIIEKPLADERALRGGSYFPHKELVVSLLRALYRGAPKEFPIRCTLEELHIDAFSNFLVDYRQKGFGDFLVHRKSYLLTSRDAFLRACTRYADQVSAAYRQDVRVSIKALLENSVIRSNESLRNFVYKVLELTVKEYVERHACWDFLWDANENRPRAETATHPLVNSYLRAVLEIKGIRVSREVRTANGAVDFFCSYTTPRNDVLKVCIEVKNAHGTNLENGIAHQLPAYMNAEQTRHGIYLVLWYKGVDWPKPEEYLSREALSATLESLKPKGDYRIDAMIVDCVRPVPPSKM